MRAPSLTRVAGNFPYVDSNKPDPGTVPRLAPGTTSGLARRELSGSGAHAPMKTDMAAETWDCACGASNTTVSPVCIACGRAAVSAVPTPAIAKPGTDGPVALLTREGGGRAAFPPPARPVPPPAWPA